MSKEYKVSKIKDLLQLEDDQIDRLCAELPDFLKKAKLLIGGINNIGESLGQPSLVAKLVDPLIWIDDGKQEITAIVTAEGEELAKTRLK